MIWWLPDYEIGTPPIPDATDVRRMAVDAVRDGLVPDFVARLFGLDPGELQALLAVAPATAKYAHEPVDEAADGDDPVPDLEEAETASDVVASTWDDDWIEAPDDETGAPTDDVEERAHADQ